MLVPATRTVEPVGRQFLSYVKWKLSNFENGANDSEDNEDETLNSDNFEFDLEYLMSLDPKEWKDHDHYKILGLHHLRHRATEDDIRRAYRQLVLKHHPDKRKAAGEEVIQDCDYFTCITRSYELLSNAAKRRAFDSVDPTFDSSVPPVNENSKTNFFEIFKPVFKRNARWSNIKPVPQLGTLDSSRSRVESFYKFWYEFDSWREYSYLDEEEKEKGVDREERKWIERQNKAVRAVHKKEEMARIRQLVDNAYECDPRVIKFRDMEKEKKMQQKKAKQDAARQRKEQEERAAREAAESARKAKEAAEAEERLRAERERREKEQTKKAINRQKENLHSVCKDHDYFTDNVNERLKMMTEIERMCQVLSLARLEELHKSLSDDISRGKEQFFSTISEVRNQLEKENNELFMASNKSANNQSSGKKHDSKKDWSNDELQLLIKAVNLFPAGTSRRWEVIATFINQHHSNPSVTRTAKDVLGRAKDLQSEDFSKNGLKDSVNKNAYQLFQKQHHLPNGTTAAAESAPTAADPVEKSEGADSTKSSANVAANAASAAAGNLPWTPEEQRLLEQSLKTYPASCPDRWDKISSVIPNRTKKDCMQRYKELAALVKAKKAAQLAAAGQAPKAS